MKVTAIYFSPTGTSKTGAQAIADAIDVNAEHIDITLERETRTRQFGAEELVVFGVPVYGGRIFQGIKKRLKQIQGDQTPCIVTVTYGNRAYDDALLELSDFVTSQGFIPIAGAALVGQHTYGEIQVGRPNGDDIAEDQAFAKELIKEIDQRDLKPVDLPGNRPYLKGEKGGQGGSFRPLTSDACVKCGLCVAQCPQGAINEEDCQTIDGQKCIACFRCIRICPNKAKNMNVEAYNAFAEKFSKQLAAPCKNEYFY